VVHTTAFRLIRSLCMTGVESDRVLDRARACEFWRACVCLRVCILLGVCGSAQVGGGDILVCWL